MTEYERDLLDKLEGEKFIIVDVGCIECGEQTEVVGIYFNEDEAEDAMLKAAKDRGIEEWEPRGGLLELCGLHNKTESTFIGGVGYFTRGQHALELHVLPARKIEQDENSS